MPDRERRAGAVARARTARPVRGAIAQAGDDRIGPQDPGAGAGSRGRPAGSAAPVSMVRSSRRRRLRVKRAEPSRGHRRRAPRPPPCRPPARRRPAGRRTTAAPGRREVGLGRAGRRRALRGERREPGRAAAARRQPPELGLRPGRRCAGRPPRPRRSRPGPARRRGPPASRRAAARAGRRAGPRARRRPRRPRRGRGGLSPARTTTRRPCSGGAPGASSFERSAVSSGPAVCSVPLRGRAAEHGGAHPHVADRQRHRGGLRAGERADREHVGPGGGRADRPAPGRGRALLAGAGDHERAEPGRPARGLRLGRAGEPGVRRVDADERDRHVVVGRPVAVGVDGVLEAGEQRVGRRRAPRAPRGPDRRCSDAIRIGSHAQPGAARAAPASAVPEISVRDPPRGSAPGAGSRSRSTAS